MKNLNIFNTFIILSTSFAIIATLDTKFYNYIAYNQYLPKGVCTSLTLSRNGCHEIISLTTKRLIDLTNQSEREAEFGTTPNVIIRRSYIVESGVSPNIFKTPNQNEQQYVSQTAPSFFLQYFLTTLNESKHIANKKFDFAAFDFENSETGNYCPNGNEIKLKYKILFFGCEAEMIKFSEQYNLVTSPPNFVVEGYKRDLTASEITEINEIDFPSLAYRTKARTTIQNGNFPLSNAQGIRRAFSGASGVILIDRNPCVIN